MTRHEKQLQADLRWVSRMRNWIRKINDHLNAIEADLQKRSTSLPRIKPGQGGAPGPGRIRLNRKERLINQLAALADQGKVRLRRRPGESRSDAFCRRFSLKSESELAEILKRHK